MAFEKGQSGNPKGKPKGAKGKKTKQWEELGLMHEEGGAATANKIMNYYADKAFGNGGIIDEEKADKFMDHYKSLLEYFKPKQSRVENQHEGETTIRVIRE